MTFPKVSICIPTYNQTKFLKRNLESILIQDYIDYEIIITDDSTTNDVELLIKSYDFNGKLFYTKNETRQGSPANWNKSISIARGEFIKILHHDDWFLKKTSLSKFVAEIEKDPTCFFVFSNSSTYIKKIFKKNNSINEEALNILRKDPKVLMLANYIGGPSATIFRKSLQIEFDPNLKWLVDIEFYIRIISLNSKIKYIKEPLIATIALENHQITRQYESDLEIELLEYLYVYKKHCAGLNYKNKEFLSTHFQKLFYLNKNTIETNLINQKLKEDSFIISLTKISKLKSSIFYIQNLIKSKIKQAFINLPL